MKTFISWIKTKLPAPIKNALRPTYQKLQQWTYKISPKSYQQQKDAELNRFNLEEEVNDLPDIFHYWSNKYLVPKLQSHGFSNPNEFFLKYAIDACQNSKSKAAILSIGAGNCDTEVALAKSLVDLGRHNFTIDCMDINEVMFERGKKLATTQGVADKICFLPADFNDWQADKKYHLIIANQSLHHVTHLEHLYVNIELALNDNGKFITSDVIGKNGHQRWPEALALLKPIWQNMPKKYQYNHATKWREKHFINHDCSTQGFEGIRAQDVLPLLVNRFDFELFIPFANLIMVFIDRTFGHNFDVNNPEDLAFIDAIHELDEEYMTSGQIKPTMMMAVMTAKSSQSTQQKTLGANPLDSIRPILK